MVNIRTTDRQKAAIGSPRNEVGEIDTRAPFQSVKAAVSLFGEVAVSREKRTPRRSSKLSSENVIDKETQLLLVQKENQRIKQQLESAEATKSRALSELDRAKRTLEDLSAKLKGVNESKQTVIEATEAVKEKSKQLEHAKSQKQLGNDAMKQELDQARKLYSSTASELDAAKQELNKIRQDFDAALEAKLASFQRAGEAQRTANTNSEKVSELQKKIAAMRETTQQLKFATVQAQEEQTKIWAEKEAREQSYRTSKEDAENKLLSLKNQYDPELTRNLELKLAEINVEIETLQEEMKRAHASEMKAVKVITAELNEATRILQEVAEEESSLRNLVSTLKLELEDVRSECGELEKIEAERNLAVLEKLTSENEKAREEAQELKKNAEALKQEAESAQTMAEEMEKKLQLVLAEAEEVRASEKKARAEMNVLSERQHIENQESSSRKIRISAAEFESFQKKAEDSDKLADAKVAEAESTLEAINASKIAADKKMEANLKAIEEIKVATDMALKSAEQAEAAQNMVEGELKKWREDEGTEEA